AAHDCCWWSSRRHRPTRRIPTCPPWTLSTSSSIPAFQIRLLGGASIMVQSVRTMFTASVIFGATVVLGAFAQTQTQKPQTPAPATAPSENTGTEGTLAPGMAINAELSSTLDSKKAKPGDAVTAKATEAVKSSDGRTILPKGAKLMGKVTESKSRAKGDSDSVLGIQFDKAMLKDGQAVGLTNVA